MKLTAMVLAAAFALTSTCAFAHTVGRGSTVTAHPMYRDAAPSVALYGNRDVWGHWGTYYGPTIPTGAGGR